ncbi:F-box/kelch-repeat protein At3g23880-like [Lycium barbarum]|uniref:F-box/kelch-repeat protein At3g23880-like n=1 Tax=Lycium barbarum TaxID=112863 RepID=UPI00293ECE50|nr:F-box/kelch-repeat protein At3g23880-like [Lycium barbarum]
MKDSILPIPTLPPELITEILSRLPVKSLLRLKCVSKSFVALISSPEFIKTQLCISTNNKDYANHRLLLRYKCLLKDCSLRSVLYESVMEVSHLNYPMTNQRKTFWTVVGSVNGLICLSNEANVLCLWNSSIRKFKKFPDFITHLRVRVVYGFGYDEFYDDYKVVRCVYYDGSWPRVDVKIYSLKDDSWRSICYAPPDGVRLWGSGKFVNGKLHWANNTGPVRDKGWNIISIDLADDKWEKVEQPCCGEEEGVLVLGVLGNNLSVISKDNHLRTHIDVWVMKEYGVKESWTKMFTVKCPHSPASSVFKALFLVSNKDEILLMFGQNFLLYNLKDGSINYPKFNKFVSGVVKAIYVESLVSPVLQHEPRTQYE